MTNKEIAHYVNNEGMHEILNVLAYNKISIPAYVTIEKDDIGWDVSADGSVTIVLFIDRKHIFHKQSKNDVLEYVCARSY